MAAILQVVAFTKCCVKRGVPSDMIVYILDYVTPDPKRLPECDQCGMIQVPMWYIAQCSRGCGRVCNWCSGCEGSMPLSYGLMCIYPCYRWQCYECLFKYSESVDDNPYDIAVNCICERKGLVASKGKPLIEYLDTSYPFREHIIRP